MTLSRPEASDVAKPVFSFSIYASEIFFWSFYISLLLYPLK